VYKLVRMLLHEQPLYRCKLTPGRYYQYTSWVRRCPKRLILTLTGFTVLHTVTYTSYKAY